MLFKPLKRKSYLLLLFAFILHNKNANAIYYSSKRYTNNGDPRAIGLAGASAASKDIDSNYYDNPAIISFQKARVNPTFIYYNGSDNRIPVTTTKAVAPNNHQGFGLGISYKFTEKFGTALSVFVESTKYESERRYDIIQMKTQNTSLSFGYNVTDELSLGIGVSLLNEGLVRENQTGDYNSNSSNFRLVFAANYKLEDDLTFNFIFYPQTVIPTNSLSNNINEQEDVKFINPGKIQLSGLYTTRYKDFYFTKINLMSQVQIYYFNNNEKIYTPYSLLNESKLNSLILSDTLLQEQARYNTNLRIVPKIAIQMIKKFSDNYNYEILLGSYLEPPSQETDTSRPHMTLGMMTKLNYINLGFSTDAGFSPKLLQNYLLFCLSFGINFDLI